jgi:NitT/TauT family transport system permease protein
MNFFKKYLSPLQLAGWGICLVLWFLITDFGIINSHILPTPQKTINAFSEMKRQDHLLANIFFSIKINILGYFKSILAAIVVGFAIGLFKPVRKMFDGQVNALRFVPITALMGIFVAISGLTIATKINFLAFGIWVYLVPVVVQRIDEVSQVHLQMMKTLGASFWQSVRYVIWPSVISRLSDDIRILVGISWTYIIVAELTNIQGGLGSLIFLGQRQSNIGKVYVCIIIIVIIGLIQDALFKLIDKILFKFKYS